MTEILDNNNTGELTVLKVYELAADAGKECQQLIELYGHESASNVTLKIISILEHLELLVNEKTELEKKVVKLNEDHVFCKNELDRKTDESNHLQTEMHKLEDQHLEDLEEWKELLSNARRENKDLKRQLNEKEGQVIQEKVQEQETLKVLLKLKETVDKQRDLIRAKDSELRSKNLDVEALQQQVERLAKVNSNLRRKQEVVESHSRHLIRQKSHLQVDVMALNKNLNLQKTHASGDQTEAGNVNGSPRADNKEEEGRIVFDPKDPDRPRFTLDELRKVLVERDEMHLKVVALEEELDSYRCDEDQADGPANVSGSSPRDDQSGKNKPLGIRKFFANLFKGKDKTDVEEELKKWEFLDFDPKDIASVETNHDKLSVSIDMGTAKSSGSMESPVRRRHSDVTPYQSGSEHTLNTSEKTDSWFSGLKKSFGASKEMVDMSSPQRPQAASSPEGKLRSSSLQDIPPPRSTPAPFRDESSDGEEGEGQLEEEGGRRGGTKSATPFLGINTSLIPVETFLYSPY